MRQRPADLGRSRGDDLPVPRLRPHGGHLSDIRERTRLRPPAATATTWAALAALTLADGTWAAAPAIGAFRLANQPTGTITADVFGAQDGTTFPTTVGTIMPMLIKATGLLSDRIAPSLTGRNESWCLYADTQTTVGEELKLALKASGCAAIPTADGKYAAMDFYSLNPTPVKINSDQSANPIVRSYKQLAIAPPVWQVVVSGERSWHEQSESEVSQYVSIVSVELEAKDAEIKEAKAEAALAQAQADAQKRRVDDIQSDGILDRSEKADQNRRYTEESAIKVEMMNKSTSFDVTDQRASYLASYNNLSLYLNSLNPSFFDLTQNTPITSTYGDYWKSYELAKVTLANAMTGDASLKAVWGGVSGTGKPENYATVGAPAGTNVGGRPAETVISNIDAALAAVATLGGAGYLDTEAPSIPTGLTLSSTITDNGANLSLLWNASSASDFDRYVVAIKEGAGSFIEFQTTSPNYLLSALPRNLAYTAKVAAVDKAGNKSGFSTAVSWTTAKDDVAPSPVTNIRGTATYNGLSVQWTNPADSDLRQVRVDLKSATDNSTVQSVFVDSSPSTTGSQIFAGLNKATSYFVNIYAIDTSSNTSAGLSSAVFVTTGGVIPSDFAPNVSAITTVTSLPTVTGYTGSSVVMLNGELYRLTNGAWSKTVSGSDIVTGTIPGAALVPTTAIPSTITVANVSGLNTIGDAFSRADWNSVVGVTRPADNAGKIQDTRSTNEIPGYYYALKNSKGVGESQEFKNASFAGSGSSGFGTLITTAQWQDPSGGPVKQVLTDSANVTFMRASIDNNTWGAWNKEYSTLNKPKLGGDILTASGTTITEQMALNANQIWSEVNGVGKPQDNASADVTLSYTGTEASTTYKILGNTFTKVGGLSQFSSSNGNAGTVAVSLAIAGAMRVAYSGIYAQQATVVGLVNGGNRYVESIVAGFETRAGGTVYTYESGVSSASQIAIFDANTRFEIVYNGAQFKWIINGNTVKIKDAPANLTYTPHFHIATIGTTISNIAHSVYSDNNWNSVAGAGKPADYASVGDNILPNTAFNNDTNGWALTGNTVRVARTATDPAAFLRGTGNNTGFNLINAVPVSLAQRNLYWSYWRRGSVAGNQRTFDINFYDGAKGYLGFYRDNNYGAGYLDTTSTTGVNIPANTWGLVTGSAVMPLGTAFVTMGSVFVAGASDTNDATLPLLSTSEQNVNRNPKIAGMDAGAAAGDNLIVNADFRDGVNNFVLSRAGGFVATGGSTTTDPLFFARMAGGSGDCYLTCGSNNRITVQAGRTAYISGKVRSSKAGAQFVIGGYSVNAAGVYGGAITNSNKFVAVANAWEDFEFKVTIPDASATAVIQFGAADQGAGNTSDFSSIRMAYTQKGATFGAPTGSLVGATAAEVVEVRANDPATRINQNVVTIDGAKLTAGTVTANQIAAGTITADRISSGTITADKIAANTITANRLSLATRPTATAGLNFRVALNGNLEWDSGAIQYADNNGNYIIGGIDAGSWSNTANDYAHVLYFPGNATLLLTGDQNYLVNQAYKHLLTYQRSTGILSMQAGVATIINGDKIVTGSINAAKIVAGSITSDQIAARSIIAGDLVAGTITATEIAANAIAADKIMAGAITTDKMTANTINGDRITGRTIAADKLFANSITANELQANSVTAGAILAGAITTDKMTANTINGDRITAGTLAADKIVAFSITGNQIAANSITATNIVAGSISADKLLIGDTTNFAENSDFSLGNVGWTLQSNGGALPVITQTSASEAYQGTWIGAASASTAGGFRNRGLMRVTPGDQLLGFIIAKCGNATIYPRISFLNSASAEILQIPGNSVAANGAYQRSSVTVVVPAGAVAARVEAFYNVGANGFAYLGFAGLMRRATGELIVDGAITADKIAARSITADRLGVGIITATELASNSIIADKIAPQAISTDKLAANAITSDKIAANAITADKIAANSITANLLTLATRPVSTFGLDICAGNDNVLRWDGGYIQFVNSAGTYVSEYVAPGTATMPNGSAAVYVYYTAGSGILSATTTDTVALGTPTNKFIANWYGGAKLTIAAGVGTLLNGDRIITGTIAANKIMAKSITSNEILAGTISAAEIAAGAITTTKLAVGSVDATIIQDGSVTTPKIIVGSLNGDRITTNTLDANTVRAGTVISNLVQIANTGFGAGFDLGAVAVAANNPANRINAGTTTIAPGLVTISGGTTLANWRNGSDTTKIEGGSIAANTITANKITIGNRGINISGIDFSYNRQDGNLYWSSGYIYYVDDGNVPRAQPIAASGLVWQGGSNNYIYWNKGAATLSAGVDNYGAIAAGGGANAIVMCTWGNGNNFNANYGGTIVDGDRITTGSIQANRLNVGTLSAITANIGEVTAGIIRSTDGNTNLNLNNGRLSFTKGGYRKVNGAGLGPNSNMVLWYGPTTVGEGSETIQNSRFALGTDGKVYYGAVEIGAGGAASTQTVGVGTAITKTLAPGQSVNIDAAVFVDNSTARGNMNVQVTGGIAGGGQSIILQGAGSYVGPGEPSGDTVSGSYQNTTGVKQAFTFVATANSVYGGSYRQAQSYLTI
ncbi:hypothetical protein QP179_10050 [Sphingomonas aurantiaca]|uniref:hypothetical protein n=1 Tax=Sphingomonas aurantiaca TaxID=185949 RepID=UPI002FE29756